MFKPWWMILLIDGDIQEYYTHFLHKRTGLILQKPAWGPHISVIRGEEPINKSEWGIYDGLNIEVRYDPDLRTDGDHWWLRVECEAMLDLRERLGLARNGRFGLHLTLGRPIPRHLWLSNYYHKIFTSRIQ